MQSRAEVVSLGQGDGVIFAVRERGSGNARALPRSAAPWVSRIKSGERFTLGIPRRGVSLGRSPNGGETPYGCDRIVRNRGVSKS
jgi:hypothetical protein